MLAREKQRVYSVGVYDPRRINRAKVYKLYNDNRLNFYAARRLYERNNLYTLHQQTDDESPRGNRLKASAKFCVSPPKPTKCASMLEKLENRLSGKLTPQEITELQKLER